MSVQTLDHEPSLFDPKPASDVHVDADRPQASQPAEAAKSAEPTKRAKAPKAPKTQAVEAEGAEPVETPHDDMHEGATVEAAADEADPAKPADEDAERNDRKRIEEQLNALRRKEAELLRALAITDHPDLADAIRTIEARVYCVARAEAKLAQGLSKSEARRQEVLTKKLSALREKRAELDTQIASLEADYQELGASRLTDFQRERQDALQSLMIGLAQHEAAIGAAGLDVRALLPEISSLLPELEAIARGVCETRADA
jgi:chromosome segregation ATPase